jgi:serine/threonine-protein kinase SRPK3
MFSVVNSPTDYFLQPPKFSPVRWLEGVEVVDSTPRYLMATQRLRGSLKNAYYSTLLVKIGDLGGGNMLQQKVFLLKDRLTIV